MFRFLFILFGILLLMAGCRDEPKTARTTSHFRFLDDTLVRYNKGIMKTEEQEIEDFLARYGWQMTRTETGLRYVIYFKGEGDKMETGKKIKMNYSVKLLNGRPLYASKTSGPKEFIAGKSDAEPGLNELALYLRKGDKVKAILPSHLAFGLLGDQNMIPPGATLVYDIEVTGVSSVKN